MHGAVLDSVSKKPVVGATIDVWEASTNGMYEQQDKAQVDMNLRGKFKTDADGRYSFYCLRPTPYPIPYDGKQIATTSKFECYFEAYAVIGPAGELLQMLDRHPYRPAHIHLMVSYKCIIL